MNQSRLTQEVICVRFAHTLFGSKTTDEKKGHFRRTLAIYHLSVKVVSRGKGHNALAASAYRSGEKLHDERLGVTHDYRRIAGRVKHTEIMTPMGAPTEFNDRSRLHNTIEAVEKRKDARLLREIEVALSRKLSLEQNKRLLREFINAQFISKGMIADFSIHNDQNNHNPHAHILLTTREITADGFGKKNRDWNEKELLEEWRKTWAETVNKYLKLANRTERIDHRSHKDRGIKQKPTVHMGKEATAMERSGIETRRGNQNRMIKRYNRLNVRQQWNGKPSGNFRPRSTHWTEVWDNATSYQTVEQNTEPIYTYEPEMTFEPL